MIRRAGDRPLSPRVPSGVGRGSLTAILPRLCTSRAIPATRVWCGVRGEIRFGARGTLPFYAGAAAFHTTRRYPELICPPVSAVPSSCFSAISGFDARTGCCKRLLFAIFCRSASRLADRRHIASRARGAAVPSPF